MYKYYLNETILRKIFLPPAVISTSIMVLLRGSLDLTVVPCAQVISQVLHTLLLFPQCGQWCRYCLSCSTILGVFMMASQRNPRPRVVQAYGL